MEKSLIKRLSFGKWAAGVTTIIVLVAISYIGYTIYNRQNEEKGKLLDEISSLRSETERLNNELGKAKSDVNNLLEQISERNDEASWVIEQQNIQINKESICRQADDLLLEIKQACDIKPFPGIDECIKNVEREIKRIENREGSLSVLDEEHLQSYGIYDRLNKQRELLIELTGLKSRYLPLKNECGE